MLYCNPLEKKEGYSLGEMGDVLQKKTVQQVPIFVKGLEKLGFNGYVANKNKFVMPF